MNRNRKNNTSKRKNIILKTTAIALSAVLGTGSVLPVLAADTDILKDENVYVTLMEDGSVSNVYVVNEFTSVSDSEVTDYGNYNSVKNLTTDSEIAQNGDEVSVDVTKGKFYYQGNMETKDIPWNISISYKLDGKEISASELAGQSGHLEIEIKTSENKNCDSTFFENYLLQATVVLNTELCSNIEADGATAGNVGTDRQLLYNIMADQEKDIKIEADVEDFEMDGITFKGVPMGFDIDKDSIDTDGLKDKTKDIRDAAREFDDGAKDLKDGTKEALDGSEQLSDGAGKLVSGVDTLIEGGNTLNFGSQSLLSGAVDLQSGIKQYTTGTASLIAGMKQYIKGTGQLSAGAKQLEDLEKLGDVTTAVTKLASAVNTNASGKDLTTGSAKLVGGLTEIKKQVDALAVSTSAQQLKALVQGLNEAKTSLDILSSQTSQLAQLVSADAQAAQAVSQSHSAVMASLNEQVNAANQQIAASGADIAAGVNEQIGQVNEQISEKNTQLSSSAQSVNSQIDTAIAAVNAATENGAIDGAQASGIIGQLEASRVSVEGIGNVEEVSAPDTSGITISMPTEDQSTRGAAAQLTGSVDTISGAAEQYQTASGEFAEKAGQINVSDDTENMLGQLQIGIDASLQGATELQAGIAQVASGLTELQKATEKFPEAAKGIEALNSGFKKLQKNNKKLLSGADQLSVSAVSLRKGASSLVSGVSQVSGGITSAVGGMGLLKTGTDTLKTGSNSLSEGLKSLDDGTAELKDGTAEFKEKTSDIDDQIDEEIDDMLNEISGSDYTPVSFVSADNTDIGLVQFAIRTDDINK